MLLKPSPISELFMDNNSEQAETDNVTGEEDGSYKEYVSHCYSRSTYPASGVTQNVPVYMCHMGSVHPVPLKKMTTSRVQQINKHHNSQETHGKHSSQCGTHL
jgi:hypothetical protein